LASGKLPEANQTEVKSSGQTRDKVGSALGVSGKTYEKAKKVAATGDGSLIKMMDEQSVDAAYRELRERFKLTVS